MTAPRPGAPGGGGVGTPAIDLRCQDVAGMLAGLPDGCAAFVHADPPWRYDVTGGISHDPVRGSAGAYYAGLPDAAIAAHLAASYRVVAAAAYLAVWCTFPKLREWLRADDPVLAAGWGYVTGGAWGKTNGLGVGFHVRGDAELLLLYKKGSPRPLTTLSNLWLAHRLGHSEKPQTALRALVAMAAPYGGLVVDCYAGDSASMARACRALNRNYIGAELSPSRHALAMTRLSQQEALDEPPPCERVPAVQLTFGAGVRPGGAGGGT